MEKVLLAQYEFVKDSRNILFDFCESIRPDDFTKEIENFGKGSIRNLLAHIENSYNFWLRDFALHKEFSYTKAEDIKNINDVRKIFEKIDLLVPEFLESFRDKYETPLTNVIRNVERTASPLKLFMHVITHEFHHKGQVLSMSRHLGYIPVDTDVIR